MLPGIAFGACDGSNITSKAQPMPEAYRQTHNIADGALMLTRLIDLRPGLADVPGAVAPNVLIARR